MNWESLWNWGSLTKHGDIIQKRWWLVQTTDSFSSQSCWKRQLLSKIRKIKAVSSPKMFQTWTVNSLGLPCFPGFLSPHDSVEHIANVCQLNQFKWSLSHPSIPDNNGWYYWHLSQLTSQQFLVISRVNLMLGISFHSLFVLASSWDYCGWCESLFLCQLPHLILRFTIFGWWISNVYSLNPRFLFKF